MARQWCLSSVTLVHPTLTVKVFDNIFTRFCTLGIWGGPCNFHEDRPRVARFLAAKYCRLLSIRDVLQRQYFVYICVCLFRSIVTMAVSLAIWEIFSVKEWRDLEMWVWGCSRSLKMARFDRPCMTFYISPPLYRLRVI